MASSGQKKNWKLFVSGIILTALSVASILAYSAYQKHIPVELKDIVNKRFPEIESRSLAYPTEQEARDNYKQATKTETPKLKIKIEPPDFAKIQKKRQQALNQGFLFSETDDYVRATIKLGEKKIKVKMRLKGDFTDHLASDKWSFRIKVSGDDHLFGMRRLSIQSPHTKYFHHEALFMEHLKKENLLAIRYFFVDVSINDGPTQLMAVEEHFSKELLESQGKREGAIVCFDEDDFWNSFRRMKQVGSRYGWNRYLPKIFDNWKIGWVRPFRKGKVKKSKTLSAQTEYAASILSGLAFGKLQASEVFDTEKMGRFMAIADLWGTWHPIRWHNMRFYVNPVTMKLEPIGFDANVDETWRKHPFIHKEVDIWFWQDLVKDPELRDAYTRNYTRMLQDDYLANMQQFLTEKENEYLKTLHKDYPSLPKFNFKTIKIKQEFIQHNQPEIYRSKPFEKTEFVDVEHPPHTTAVYAYVFEKNKKQYLEFINTLSSTVNVTKLELIKEGKSSPLRISDKVKFPIKLAPNFHKVKHNQDRPAPTSTIIKLSNKTNLNKKTLLTGTAIVQGQKLKYTFKAKEYVAKAEQPLFKEAETTQNLLSKFSFLKWDGQNFSIAKGKWDVKSSIQIPATVVETATNTPIHHPGLLIEAGTTLSFKKGVYLKLSGPILAAGTAENKIIFKSRNKEKYWAGIAVINSPKKSFFKNVETHNTDFTSDGPWKLTGGITFYHSDVSIIASTFNNTIAEDALNIVSSTFELDGVKIQNTTSDGFDCDFCTGNISNSEFSNIQGDAIDFSGSNIEANNINFTNIFDKAISVGEATILNASNLNISNVAIAIASKDGSKARINNANINNASFAALMAYNKKPEYAPASLEINSSSFSGVEIKYLCQTDHYLSIDGKPVYTLAFSMDNVYSSGFMQKK